MSNPTLLLKNDISKPNSLLFVIVGLKSGLFFIDDTEKSGEKLPNGSNCV